MTIIYIKQSEVHSYNVPPRFANIRVELFNPLIQRICIDRKINIKNLLGYSESAGYVYLRLPDEGIIRITKE